MVNGPSFELVLVVMDLSLQCSDRKNVYDFKVNVLFLKIAVLAKIFCGNLLKRKRVNSIKSGTGDNSSVIS